MYGRSRSVSPHGDPPREGALSSALSSLGINMLFDPNSSSTGREDSEQSPGNGRSLHSPHSQYSRHQSVGKFSGMVEQVTKGGATLSQFFDELEAHADGRGLLKQLVRERGPRWGIPVQLHETPVKGIGAPPERKAIEGPSARVTGDQHQPATQGGRPRADDHDLLRAIMDRVDRIDLRTQQQAAQPTAPPEGQSSRTASEYHSAANEFQSQGRARGKTLPERFLKGMKLKPFSGDPEEDCNEFFIEFENFVRASGVNYESWGVALESSLKGTALRWATTVDPAISSNYEAFKSAMQAEFAGPQRMDARSTLNYTKMDPHTEDIPAFIHRLEKLVTQAYPDVTIKQQKDLVASYLVQGIPKAIRKRAASALASTDLEDLKRAFIGAEAFWRQEGGGNKHASSPRKKVYQILKREDREPEPDSDDEDPGTASQGKKPIVAVANASHQANISQMVTPEYLENKFRIERDTAQQAFIQHTERVQDSLQNLGKKINELVNNRSGGNPNGRYAGGQNGYRSGGQGRNQQQNRNNRDNQPGGFRRPRRGDPDYNMCFTCGKEHFPFCSRKRDGDQTVQVNQTRRSAEEKVLTFAALDPRISELPDQAEHTSPEWVTVPPETADSCPVVDFGESPPVFEEKEKAVTKPKRCLLTNVAHLLESLIIAWTLIALVTAIPACGATLIRPTATAPTVDVGEVTGLPRSTVSPTPQATQSSSWYPQLYSKATRDAQPPPSTEDEADARARYVYRKFTNTAFAKRTSDAKGKFPPTRLNREAKKEAQAPPYLSSIFESSKPQPGAIVNLDLGAVAVPEGVALVTTSTKQFYYVMDGVVPYWQPYNLRHEKATVQCDRLKTARLRRLCHATLDPIIAKADCPGMDIVAADYEDVIAEQRARYEGSVDTEYFRAILDGYCKDGKLCKNGNGTTASPIRDRRFISFFLGLGAIAASVTNFATNMANTGRIAKLEDGMNKLHEYMKKQYGSMQALHNGIQSVTQGLEDMHEFVAEGLASIYERVESLRCAQTTDLQKLAFHVERAEFRAYLRNTLDAITASALDGKLTPNIISVPQLQELLAKDSDMADTIVAKDVSLVYRFGRVIPIMIDLVNMRYGFVLVVPRPTKKNVLPMYKIHNAGYETVHRREKRQATADALPIRAYMAPLPDRVVYMDGEFQRLDLTDCQVTPGLAMCSDAAVVRRDRSHPCLRLFLDDDCIDCHKVKDCTDMGTSAPFPEKVHSIITIAGIMIRTSDKPPVVFKDKVSEHSRTRGIPMNQSDSGTYWLTHKDFETVYVGGEQYRTQDRAIHSIHFTPPRRFNLTTLESRELATPELTKMYKLEAYRQRLEQLQDDVQQMAPEAPDDTPWFSAKSHVWSWFALFVGCVLGSVLLCCCMYKRCKCWRNCVDRCRRDRRDDHHRYRYNARKTSSPSLNDEGYVMAAAAGHYRGQPAAWAMKRQTISDYPADGGETSNSCVPLLAPQALLAPNAPHAPLGIQVDMSPKPATKHYPSFGSTISLKGAMNRPRDDVVPPKKKPVQFALHEGRRSRSRSKSPGRPKTARKEPMKDMVNSLVEGEKREGGKNEPPQTRQRYKKGKGGGDQVNVVLCRDPPVPKPLPVLLRPIVPHARKRVERDPVDRRLGFTSGIKLHRAKILVDPAADVSLMNRTYAEDVGYDMVPELDRTYVDGAVSNGQITHRVVAGVYLGGNLIEHPFLIPAEEWTHGCFDALLGTDFLSRLGKVIVDYREDHCYVVDHRTGMKYRFELTQRRPILHNPEHTPQQWTLATGDIRSYSSEDARLGEDPLNDLDIFDPEYSDEGPRYGETAEQAFARSEANRKEIARQQRQYARSAAKHLVKKTSAIVDDLVADQLYQRFLSEDLGQGDQDAGPSQKPTRRGRSQRPHQKGARSEPTHNDPKGKGLIDDRGRPKKGGKKGKGRKAATPNAERPTRRSDRTPVLTAVVQRLLERERAAPVEDGSDSSSSSDSEEDDFHVLANFVGRGKSPSKAVPLVCAAITDKVDLSAAHSNENSEREALETTASVGRTDRSECNGSSRVCMPSSGGSPLIASFVFFGPEMPSEGRNADVNECVERENSSVWQNLMHAFCSCGTKGRKVLGAPPRACEPPYDICTEGEQTVKFRNPTSQREALIPKKKSSRFMRFWRMRANSRNRERTGNSRSVPI